MVNLLSSRLFGVFKRASHPATARLERGAIVATGGKQVKVEKDQIIKVEKLNAEKGATVKLDALMIVDGADIVTGNPIKGAYVEAEVLYQDKFDKVIVYKYKAKKNERKRQGHRQPYTALKVVNIVKK